MFCIFPGDLSQYHDDWCPGSMHTKSIGSNGIDYTVKTSPSLPWGGFKLSGEMSMLKNDKNFIYVYVFWKKIGAARVMLEVWVSNYTNEHTTIKFGTMKGSTWWRHQMEIFSSLLALCVGNSPVTGEFPAQRTVTWSFDIFFDLRLNKGLSKQTWGWWF